MFYTIESGSYLTDGFDADQSPDSGDGGKIIFNIVYAGDLNILCRHDNGFLAVIAHDDLTVL